jgi:hypothetical protein
MSSSRPPRTSDGLLGDVLLSYDIAWTARRLLAAVVLPVVAVMLSVSSVLDWYGGGWRVIVDGVPGTGDGRDVAVLQSAVTVLFWLLALLSGTVAVVRDAGPPRAVLRGVVGLPFAVAVLGVAAGAGYVVLYVAAGMVPAAGSLLVVTTVLVLTALLAARLLLGVIGRIAGEAPHQPSWRNAASFLLGGVVMPMLLTVIADAIGLHDLPYAGPLAGAVVIVIALAAQIGLAARPHAAGGVLPAGAVWWPGFALIGAAVLAPPGLVVLNPYDLPSVRTHDRGPSTAMAVAWPSGRHPVIVTSGGVWFCDDDLCDRFTDVSGGPPTIDGFGTASIGVDGTVVKTAVTGGPDTGGPFVQYARCVRDGCRQAWLPVRASGREKPGPPGVGAEAAGAAAPDGSIWLFAAVPVEGGRYGRYRFLMIHCADIACAAPQRHDLGIADHTPADGYPPGRRARLTIGADGRPVASFWLGWSVYRFSCEPVTCAGPRRSDGRAAPPDAVWATAGDRTIAVRAGELYDGDNSAMIAPGAGAQSGAVAAVGPYVYLTAALPGTGERGFHVTIGEPARYWRQTVWRCSGLACTSAPMDGYAGEPRRELLAVADDGRILVVRDDRIVLRETPFVP